MSRIPESIINDVRSKADIVDTVSRYLTLTKKGKNYWGVCPFHDDHDPSMSVSPDRQIYKCFVCGAGGNVFSFIQNIESISFMEAVAKTAESYNVDLSSYQVETKKVEDPRKTSLYKVLEESAAFMAYQLFTKDGELALEKLEQRGYSHELIRKFGIGVALGNNSLFNFLTAKGYDSQTILEADLIRISEDGQIRDVFYNRIVFPIHNIYGNVIGFSARALSDSNSVKYINTGETPVYVKGNTLYNYHLAKETARKNGSLIITEGVTDAIAFTKIGANNVVSLLGVAGTPEQIRLIKQASLNVILAFDGDKAGFEATYTIGSKLIKAGCNVSVWYNDSGMDPDEAVRKQGEKSVIDGIENKLSWYDFSLAYATLKYGLDNFDKRKRVAEFVLDQLKGTDSLTLNYYLKILETKTGFDVNTLTNLVLNNKSKNDLPVKSFTPRNIDKKIIEVSIPERAILLQMLNSKEAAYHFRDKLGFLITDLANELALVVLDCYRTQDFVHIADILSRDISDTVRRLAVDIESSEIDGSFNLASLNENIAIIKREVTRLGVKHLTQEGMELQHFDEQVELLKKVIEQQRNRNK